MATIKKIKIGTTTYDIRDASVPSQIAALDGTATVASVDAATSEISIRDQVVETDGRISTSETVVGKTYTSDKIDEKDAATLEAAKKYHDNNQYVHPTHTAHDNGLYKITVNDKGHVTAAVAVAKEDITGLGIPGSNTTYSFAEGTTNGAFSVTPSGGSAQSVKIHGLGSAAYTASSAYDAAGAASTAESNAKNYTYSKSDIDAKDKNTLDSAKGYARELISGLGTVMKFKGTLASETDLKAIKGAKKGEVYVVTADGSEWVATADASSDTATTTWEKFGTTDVANPLYKDDTAFVSGYLLKADGTAGKVKAVAANGAAVGLGNVTNNRQVKGLASGTTANHIVIWGADGYTVADGGVLGSAAHSNAADFDAAGAADTVSTYLKNYIDSISIVSGGGHTHGAGTLSGSCTPQLNPTKKHITASASGTAVTLGSTQYISAIDATKSYLSKGTIAANTFATGISVAASTSSANTDLFHASYDSTNECLDLSPMKVSAVKSHSAINYANGSLQATDSGLAQVCTGLGTPTKSAPKVASVTNPTITLSNTATTGGVELLESVSGDTTTVTISGKTETGGSHSHGVSFAK